MTRLASFDVPPVQATADFFHVDVFASRPLTGNGLAVFLGADQWSARTMQRLAQEMKQFESIFLSQVTDAGAHARVFTVEEELPFAGHPVLGAAVVLHRTQAPEAKQRSWVITLPAGESRVSTASIDHHHHAEMDQGAAVFGEAIRSHELQSVLSSLGLDSTDLAAELPVHVVSTGLPYLILPVRPGALARAAIRGADLESQLAVFGARFSLLLDVTARELRTWDNLGRAEDVATGSAAGPAAAYLYQCGLADPQKPVALAQGRFAGRPSRMLVTCNAAGHLLVSGEVWPVSRGVLELDRLTPPGLPAGDSPNTKRLRDST